MTYVIWLNLIIMRCYQNSILITPVQTFHFYSCCKLWYERIYLQQEMYIDIATKNEIITISNYCSCLIQI